MRLDLVAPSAVAAAAMGPVLLLILVAVAAALWRKTGAVRTAVTAAGWPRQGAWAVARAFGGHTKAGVDGRPRNVVAIVVTASLIRAGRPPDDSASLIVCTV